MRNVDNNRCYTIYCIICTPCFVVVATWCFLVGMALFSMERTYVPTDCLVKNSFLETCEIIVKFARNSLNPQRCLRSRWLVEYTDSTIKEQIINGSEFWVDHDDDNNQIDSFKKYKIGETYPCYYSSYLKRVQWNEPNFSAFIGLMICATLSTLFCIIGLLIRHRNITHQNRQLRPAVPIVPTVLTTRTLPTTSTESDSLVTPPPPYTPSFDGVDQDGFPLRLPSTVHTEGEGEGENIPLSPPPPYTP